TVKGTKLHGIFLSGRQFCRSEDSSCIAPVSSRPSGACLRGVCLVEPILMSGISFLTNALFPILGEVRGSVKYSRQLAGRPGAQENAKRVTRAGCQSRRRGAACPATPTVRAGRYPAGASVRGLSPTMATAPLPNPLAQHTLAAPPGDPRKDAKGA